MTNRYYNSTFQAVPLTTIRSQGDITQFAAVATGFATVEAEMDLKAPLASPTFTGTVDADTATAVLVPTVALDDATLTKAASIGWVQAYFTSSLDLIPPVSGQSGKFLTNDGTSASWALPIPSQTGHATKVLKTDGASASWSNASNFLEGTYHQLAGDLTLTASSGHFYVDCAGVTAGTRIRLPDATTIPNGWVITIGDADASNEVAIETSDGELMATAQATGDTFRLESNATAVGTWRTVDTGVASPLLSTPGSTYVASPELTLRSTKDRAAICEVSSGVYLVCTGAAAGSGVDVFVASVSGMTITTGTVTTVGTDTVAWIAVKPVTGGFVCLYATASGGAVYGIGITVSGTTATAGARTTVIASISGLALRAESNGTDVLLLAQTTTTVVSGIMVDTSGTGVNVGTLATLFTAAGAVTNTYLAACSLSASVFGIAAAGTDSAVDRMRVLSVSYSGLTLTVGTVTTGTQAGPGGVDVVPLTSTSMLMAALRETTTASLRVTVVSALTTTPVDNIASDYASTTSITIAGQITLVACGSYYVACLHGSADAHLATVSVSGTTVSLVGSLDTTTLQSTNAHEGFKPYWDGQYLHLSRYNYPEFRLYSVSGTGVALGPSAGVYGTASGTCTPGLPYTFRISGEKKAALFGADCTARVIRWGANS